MNKKTNEIANTVVMKTSRYTNISVEVDSSITAKREKVIALEQSHQTRDMNLHSHAVRLSGFKRQPSGQIQAIIDRYSSSATQR